MPPEASPSTNIRPFFIACCLLLIVMECVGIFSSKSVAGSRDFRNFYAAGVMIRTEPSRLYDLAQQKQVQDTLIEFNEFPLPYVHPSYEALVYAPFALLPYRAAYLVFMVFNALLIVATFFAARPLFSKKLPFLEPRPGLIFFLFAPLLLVIWHGQDSILFLLLTALTWRQLDSGKDLSAGCILALALFRFQLAVPIAILVAVRRGWKFSAGFIATGAAVVLLSVGIVGRAGSEQLIRLLSAVSLSTDHSAAAQGAMAMHPLAMPNIFGLFFALGTQHLSPAVSSAAVTLASAALFLWCLYRTWHEPNDNVAFSIAILCSILVSYHLYLHDATLLLLPIVLLSQPRHRYLLLAFYWLPAILLMAGGPRLIFLLAIAILALLVYALRGAKSQPITTADTPSASPLYT